MTCVEEWVVTVVSELNGSLVWDATQAHDFGRREDFVVR